MQPITNEEMDLNKIISLLKTYNKAPYNLRKSEADFVRNDLINVARQMGIDLTFYSDGERIYVGPKYLRNPSDFALYRMPKSLVELPFYGLRLADAEEQFEKGKDKIEIPKSLKDKAKYYDFSEIYNSELNNGNTEYIYFNPQYKAVLHFELKPDGTPAPIYSLDKEPNVLVSIEYGETKRPVVKYLKFNDMILENLEKETITRWPEIVIGEAHYFTSTEDREYLDDLEEFVNNDRKQRFFSIRTLQKISLCPELVSLMGFNNATLIDQMSKVGLTQDDAFALIKEDGNNLV